MAEVEGKRRGTGRSGQLFAFGWRDVAALLGVKVDTAQKMAAGGRFDPRDLASIAAFWRSRLPPSQDGT